MANSRSRTRARFSKTDDAAVSRIPVWTTTPVFSTLQEGVAATFALGVGAEGDQVTVTWGGPGAKPAWVAFSAPSASPSITFSGSQGPANNTTALILLATANGVTTPSATGTITVAPANANYGANPSNYTTVLSTLPSGATLTLVSGNYTSGMSIYGKTNITIQGPTDRSARIVGQAGQNTVRISGSNNVTIKNLTIDSNGQGGDGINAQSNVGPSYAITIENCRFTGCDDSQSTAGIGANSASCWDWTIRDNIFDGCGTGMYLGNSDGAVPFVRGIIEGNFFNGTIGYNCEIKGQTVWGASIPGRPEGTTKTIIRNNVWYKSAATSSTGGNARPCLLLGGHPAAGTGASNTYEVYGNFFAGNPTDEPLLQVAGNCYIYNNVFYNVDAGSGSLGGIYARDWTSTAPTTTCPVKNIEVFSNTFVIDAGIGVDIASASGYTRRVIGNAIYAPTATALTNATASSNTTGTFAAATGVMNRPDGVLGATLDLHPKAGQLSGSNYSDAAWNGLTSNNVDFNAANRVFLVRGAYGTQGTNPGWLLQLNKKGQGISAPASTLTITYTADEGTAIRPGGGAMYWQSNFTTRDGTLIEWGTGDHGHTSQNDVAEYDPISKVQSTVEPTNITTANGWRCAQYGYLSQYDNLIYYYVPSIDSLVILPRGQYVRGSSSRDASVKFPIASRTEVDLAATTARGSGTSFMDGQPLGWKNGVEVVGTSLTSLIRPLGILFSGGATYVDQFISDFNCHQTWSKQLDCGVRISGSGGGNSEGRQYIWIMARSANYGSYSQRYIAYRKDMPATVGGVRPWKYNGRDGAKFVGEWLYWVGGSDTNGGTETPHFFRMRMTPHLFSAVETSAALVSGPGAIERLPDSPITGQFPLLVHDHVNNALVMIVRGGLAMFDLRTFAWSVIDSSAYATEYSSLGRPMPSGCLGDFIESRSGVAIRKVIWRPGASGASDGTANLTERRYRSVKINRPSDPVSFTATDAALPENASNSFSLMNGPKHISIRAVGSGATRKLILFSGDWNQPGWSNAGFPPSQKPSGSGCQDIWEADISDSAIASGNVRWTLAQNYYHNYPYGDGGGYWGPGRPGGGVEPQRGPYIPDAYGWCVDKRGTYWMGPTGNDNGSNYLDPTWEIAGYEAALYVSRGAVGKTPGSYMFNWKKPTITNPSGVYGVPGVRMGGNGLPWNDPGYEGWSLPTQDRLYFAWTSDVGVDYEIAPTIPGSQVFTYGYGRVNPSNTVYNADTDRIYILLAGGTASGATKNFMFRLYSMDVSPAGYAANGNRYTWTPHAVATLPMQAAVHDTPAVNLTGINIGGDENRGCLKLSPTMIGTKIYFVFTCYLYMNDGTGNSNPSFGGTGRRQAAFLFSIDVLSNAVEWIPFPEFQNWWIRTFDGPDSAAGLAALTPAQGRSLDVIGTKLVLGPDGGVKIGTDPLFSVYNTTTNTWSTLGAPANHDFPSTSGGFVAVPDLGEVWGIANQGPDPSNYTLVNSLGLHNTGQFAPTAGRRIVRLMVT